MKPHIKRSPFIAYTGFAVSAIYYFGETEEDRQTMPILVLLSELPKLVHFVMCDIDSTEKFNEIIAQENTASRIEETRIKINKLVISGGLPIFNIGTRFRIELEDIDIDQSSYLVRLDHVSDWLSTQGIAVGDALLPDFDMSDVASSPYAQEIAVKDESATEPKDTHTPIEHAARWLANKTWPKENGAGAVRRLVAEGWRDFPSLSIALTTICEELRVDIPAGAIELDGALSQQLRRVFHGETDARTIMAHRDLDLRQNQIDALLRLELLPFYEWPSRIRTTDMGNAWINCGELVDLLMAGAHLPGMKAKPKAAEAQEIAAEDEPETVENRGGRLLVSIEPVKPVQRGAAQDAAILYAIRAAGLDATALPKNQPGKPGTKAAIRAALKSNKLFGESENTRIFNKVWERLRANCDIKDTP